MKKLLLVVAFVITLFFSSQSIARPLSSDDLSPSLLSNSQISTIKHQFLSKITDVSSGYFWKMIPLGSHKYVAKGSIHGHEFYEGPILLSPNQVEAWKMYLLDMTNYDNANYRCVESSAYTVRLEGAQKIDLIIDGGCPRINEVYVDDIKEEHLITFKSEFPSLENVSK